MSIQLKGNDNSSFSDDVSIGSGNITLNADGSANFADIVGIGTTATQHSTLAVADVTNGPTIEMRPDNSGVAEIHATHRAIGSNSPLNLRGYEIRFGSFGLGTAEAGKFDSSGRLLVGTSTSLSNYLSQTNYAGSASNGVLINSSATSGDGSYMLTLMRSSSPNDTTPAVYFVDSVGTRFQVRNNGGIVNYQANNANLSDRNTKKDISPAAGTWNCIKQWEIVNYRYKDQPDDADLNLGVIAQQVAESCPEVITVFEEAKDDQPEKLGIKEQQMYWMAIKALQEAQARIETLEAKVQTLEGGAS